MATVDIPVAARNKAVHRVDLSSPGVVQWHIIVPEFDIGVEVTWLNEGEPAEKRRTVMPSLRLSNDAGGFVAISKGSLEFVFDNSFSMLRSKTVQLKLSKRPIDEEAKVAAASYLLDVDKHSFLLNRLAVRGVGLFFTNKFADSESFFQYDRLRVPVYALSWATICWTKSMMTMDSHSIEEARNRLVFVQSLCETYMPKDNSLLSSIKGSISGTGNADAEPLSPVKSDAVSIASAVAAASTPLPDKLQSFTPMQMEAQLVYAEATMLMSLLHLFEESVMGLLKCGMAVRSGWRLYQQADKALGCPITSMGAGTPFGEGMRMAEVDSSVPSAAVIASFDPTASAAEHHAVLLDSLAFGIGVFSTLASVLPSAVLKVLSALGLPADREIGLAQLRMALQGGHVRSSMSGVMFLAMRILLPSFHTGDISGGGRGAEADAVLHAMLAAYPDGAFFTWLAGRLARMRGDSANATRYFDVSSLAGKELVQLDHLCLYEKSWVECFAGRWEAVLPLHARLAAENAWSKAYYCYMQGVACLQLGRLREARAHMRAVLKHGAGARRIGGRIIPAEQYAVRRAAEFVALTRIAGEPDAVDEDERSLYTLPQVEGPGLVRVTLPACVAVGSAAHACALAYPIPVPGLDSVYLFNGFSCMSSPGLHAAIRQVDAVVRAIASGGVFDAGRRAVLSAAAVPDGGSSWSQADDSAVLSADSLTTLLDSAAGAAVTGLSPPRDTSRDGAAAAPGAPGSAPLPAAPLSSPPSTPSRGLGGMLGRVGGLVTSAASTVANVAGGVKEVASMAAGAAGTAVGAALSRAGVPTGPAATYSPYACASAPGPLHAVAVAAMVRGAACAALGRAEEAAAAFGWVAAVGQGGRLRREQHTVAYSWYEMGLLYLDAARLLSQSRNTSPVASSGSTRETNMREKMLASPWVTAQGLTAASARSECVRCMRHSREKRDDFNWKVRLSIRVHLAFDELRDMGEAAEEPGVGNLNLGTDVTPKKGVHTVASVSSEADDDADLLAAAAAADSDQPAAV